MDFRWQRSEEHGREAEAVYKSGMVVVIMILLIN